MKPEERIKTKLEQLKERSQRAEEGGGVERREKQKAAGKMTARERVEFLLDEGTFEEFDKFVVHRSTDFGLDSQRYPGDGVVTGHGLVDGREVFVFAQNMRTGKPWAGAKLLISDGAKVYAEAATGEDGVLKASYEELTSAGDVRVFAVIDGHYASNVIDLSGLGVSEGLVSFCFLAAGERALDFLLCLDAEHPYSRRHGQRQHATHG